MRWALPSCGSRVQFFNLANGSVLTALGQRTDCDIFELTLNAHGVIDDNPLEMRHPETALVVSPWALVVLPKIHEGALHQGGFGIIVMFDRGCGLVT